MQVEEVRSFVGNRVDELFDKVWEISADIHAHPEVAFEEQRTSEVLRRALEGCGFEVEIPWKDLPTAFVARHATGDGPRIALFAELDALPELGHACGHNLIMTTALMAGVVAKEAMDRFGISGSIEVFGTPAEEDGGGKIIMLEEGAFDGVDAVYLMHPTSAMTRIGGICTSFTGASITFTGRAAHAESHPEEGINAMDAATLFHQAIGLARQQLPDDVHVCEVITSMSNDIGRIPAEAKLEVEVSSTTGSHVEPAMEVVRRVAKGVAIATGCEYELEEERGYLGRVPNAVLGDVCRAELEAFGEPVMEGMPGDKGGEDLGNVSRVIPSCNVFGTILPERKISGHTPEFRELAISDNAKHCLRVNSKAIAMSSLVLMDDSAANPDGSLIALAKNELARRMAEEGAA